MAASYISGQAEVGAFSPVGLLQWTLVCNQASSSFTVENRAGFADDSIEQGRDRSAANRHISVSAVDQHLIIDSEKQDVYISIISNFR